MSPQVAKDRRALQVHHHGIEAAAAITCWPMTLEEASSKAVELVESVTEQALRFMRVGARVFKAG